MHKFFKLNFGTFPCVVESAFLISVWLIVFLISLISSPANLSSTNCSVAKFIKSFLLKLFNNVNRPIQIEMYSSNIS